MADRTPSTRAITAGVLGWPISHSKSPVIHGYWLEKTGINGHYMHLPAPPESLARIITCLIDLEFAGFNVTLPHKERIMDFLDDIDPDVQRIGAVNTVRIKNGKLTGYNTDKIGFIENIRPHITIGRDTAKNALVLGAGGAARAILAGLKDMGFHTRICNRTFDKAAHLARLFDVETVAWEKRQDVLEDTDLVVNTTSQGMKGQEPLDLDLTSLKKGARVTDIVYTPLETPLLAQAREKGYAGIDGLGMLLHQAVPGFKMWFGADVTVTEGLRNAVLNA